MIQQHLSHWENPTELLGKQYIQKENLTGLFWLLLSSMVCILSQRPYAYYWTPLQRRLNSERRISWHILQITFLITQGRMAIIVFMGVNSPVFPLWWSTDLSSEAVNSSHSPFPTHIYLYKSRKFKVDIFNTFFFFSLFLSSWVSLKTCH